MDFGNALLLGSTVFLIVELANQLIPNLEGRWKVLLAIIAGQAGAWTVANSDWGAKQIVSGLRLDTMNGVSLILVGLALAGVAVGAKQGLKAIANVGQNRSETP